MNDIETRFCDHCVRFLPITEFRRRYRDGSARMAKCRECHNQAERERRAEQSTRRTRRRMRKHLTALVDDRNQKRTDLLTAVLLDDFGGLTGVVGAWRDYLADARQRGGLAMFRALQMAMRLIERANENRPDYASMSEEELEHTLTCFLREHPELVADPSLVRGDIIR